MNTFIARHIRQLTAAAAGLVLAAVLGASAQSAHASPGGVCNPSPTPSVTINNDTVYEHEGAKLTVKLSGTSCTSVSMDYKTMDGTATAGIDYVAQSGTLTFTPGQTAKNLSVQIIDDPAYEADETLYVVLENVKGATCADCTGKVWILGLEPAG